MECKSCGSVKFKNIRYGLYECEYCGRQTEFYQDILRTDNPSNDYFSKVFGYVAADPTRTISFVPCHYNTFENLSDKTKQYFIKNRKRFYKSRIGKMLNL